MRNKEQLNKLFNELESLRTINITPELIKDCSPILKEQSNYRLDEVEYMIILCSSHIFYNTELGYLIDRYYNYFTTKLSLESLIKCTEFLLDKYKELIDKYRSISTLNSFYKSALGYEYFENSYEYLENKVANDNKEEVSVYTPVLKKSIKKTMSGDRELLKILVNKYKVLDKKLITNVNELLIQLLKSNK